MGVFLEERNHKRISLGNVKFVYEMTDSYLTTDAVDDATRKLNYLS